MLSEENFSEPVLAKARRILSEGRLSLSYDQESLWMVDNGKGEEYRVRYGGTYLPSCSCPHGTFSLSDPSCAHLAAVVLYVLEEVYGG